MTSPHQNDAPLLDPGQRLALINVLVRMKFITEDEALRLDAIVYDALCANPSVDTQAVLIEAGVPEQAICEAHSKLSPRDILLDMKRVFARAHEAVTNTSNATLSLVRKSVAPRESTSLSAITPINTSTFGLQRVPFPTPLPYTPKRRR